MRFSQLLSLATTLAGGTAAGRVLVRRHAWEEQNKRVAICVDYDDAQTAAIRAGLPFDAVLKRLADNGATHISLPELTLNRLRQLGQLTPQAPTQPRSEPPRVGHWNYLHGPALLIHHLAAEMRVRLPYTEAEVCDETILVFAGDLPTVGEIGLGFDSAFAEHAHSLGLGVVPRPVSYDWPEDALIKRTLDQAAAVSPFVAFAGKMVLGHEMQLETTTAALTANEQHFVYFAESRHQRGDWFIAKRRAPHVILAHRFTPEEMMGMDYHAAAHNWVHLADERGVRFCYINFFRVLHATAPLEGIDYVHHLKHALEDAGYTVTRDAQSPPRLAPPDESELAMSGLAAAGIAATAVNATFRLPDAIATPLTVAAAGGAFALPYLESQWLRHRPTGGHDHDHHHHHHDHPHDDHEHHSGEQAHHHDHDHDHGDALALYPPSYTPKLLSLATAALAPVAALAAGREGGALGWAAGQAAQSAAAAALAAYNSGPEYQLRVEEYKGFNLDWALPLASVALSLPEAKSRAAALTAVATAWLVAHRRGIDLLAQIDPGHAQGHTHHISGATRIMGDLAIALGPRPARKWSGLGAVAQAASLVLIMADRRDAARWSTAVAALGHAVGLVSYRRPERALAATTEQALPSHLTGTALGAALLLLSGNGR